MTLKTFQEWSSEGFQIIKGSKAQWVDNIAMFSEQQVRKTQKPSFGNPWKGCAPKGTGGEYWESSSHGGSQYSEGYGDEWSLF